MDASIRHDKQKVRSNDVDYRSIRLSDRLFDRLCAFIYKEVGIHITPVKKMMLEGRLQKRLRRLAMRSFEEYCKYLFSEEGKINELMSMIDEVTTNKTDFFREPAHFDYLVTHAVPSIRKNGGGDPMSDRLTIWSAGCSSGEEPYTIIMVMKEFIEQKCDRPFSFQVIATDISNRMIEKAQKAVYEEEKAMAIPHEYRIKYLMRSKNPGEKMVRMAPEIRSLVRFRRLNFMDSDFGFREKIDIIFCRNVIIYFDKAVQERLLTRFCNYIRKGGYIFMGHSETLFGMNLPLEQVAPTVYRRR